MQSTVQAVLIALGLCDDASFTEIYPRVRDRDDISVLRCSRCGVVCLSRSDHVDPRYYEQKQGFRYGTEFGFNQAVVSRVEDDERRAAEYKGVILNRKWLEVGAGVGGTLKMLSPFASESMAIEPQEEIRQELLHRGYSVAPNLEGIPNNYFDVVTLFHVFEHLTDPIQTLKLISEKMVPGGRLIVEVPHANDFLLSFLDLDEFKEFTFWSEHLILHTRQTLTAFLAEAGFQDIVIKGYQRYPLANHLYWLSRKKQGGHHEWSHLRTPALDNAYSEMLASLDKTDTLIAFGVKHD